jgi:capsular exopolysaccharide synthesis family protein
MEPKHGDLSRIRFPRSDDWRRDAPAEGEKLTAGVPLSRLIKRTLDAGPQFPMLTGGTGIVAERFRRLKTLLLNEGERAPQVILVTSAGPAEGKSLVSANLALTFAADRECSALLIDADLRRPTLEGHLKPAPKLGLSELLRDQTELDHVVLELKNSPLRVIPAGTVASDPVELLGREAVVGMMDELRRRFQRIVIDTPPIVPFTEADVLGRIADGALVVVRAGSTRRAMLRQAVEAVTSTRVLGFVLNDVTYNLADRESHHSTKHYYSYYDKERKR